MDCSTPGLPVHHKLLEFIKTHSHRVIDAIQPSHPLSPPSSSQLQSFPASGSFPMSQLFAWGGQSIGVSASSSVLSMNTQSWFPLRLTDLIFLKFKGLQESSWAQQFESIHSLVLSLLYDLIIIWSFCSHIHTWLLEKSQVWRYGLLSAKQHLCLEMHYLNLPYLYFHGVRIS